MGLTCSGRWTLGHMSFGDGRGGRGEVGIWVDMGLGFCVTQGGWYMGGYGVRLLCYRGRMDSWVYFSVTEGGWYMGGHGDKVEKKQREDCQAFRAPVLIGDVETGSVQRSYGRCEKWRYRVRKDERDGDLFVFYGLACLQHGNP
ncbi:hypothetical protein RRG08_020420 [Elysia crispata]|uniref:Uncharacterized protein n=1 Tax=Elysia crispata TaxID=231223 RepID=A0AAE1B4X0_9GAST|nr:hypothetical protein RRG08_020420 [Elysia crispata]